MLLPTELIREIVEHALGECRAEQRRFDNSCNVKPPWARIHALSTVSRLFRILTLESWFERLYLRREKELGWMEREWPDVFDWVREIHFVCDGSAHDWDLHRFVHLRKIRIDLLDTASYDFPFVGVPASLVDVNIRNVNWPFPMVYKTIASTFARIRTLRMHQPGVWCGLCHVCEIPDFRLDGTESVTYRDGRGLPTHYATALAPLEALEAVHMTVGNLGKGPAPLNARHNADMWAGECRQCLETVVYTDAAFRREWAEKKRLALPLDKIAEAQGMGMAEWSEPKRPPLLGQVVWNFWPAVPDLIGLDS